MATKNCCSNIDNNCSFYLIAVIYFHVERKALPIKSLYTPFDEEEGFAFLIVSIVIEIIVF